MRGGRSRGSSKAFHCVGVRAGGRLRISNEETFSFCACDECDECYYLGARRTYRAEHLRFAIRATTVRTGDKEWTWSPVGFLFLTHQRFWAARGLKGLIPSSPRSCVGVLSCFGVSITDSSLNLAYSRSCACFPRWKGTMKKPVVYREFRTIHQLGHQNNHLNHWCVVTTVPYSAAVQECTPAHKLMQYEAEEGMGARAAVSRDDKCIVRYTRYIL